MAAPSQSWYKVAAICAGSATDGKVSSTLPRAMAKASLAMMRWVPSSSATRIGSDMSATSLLSLTTRQRQSQPLPSRLSLVQLAQYAISACAAL
ncbi:hypothetical protein D3C72_1258620 [compost metagenome]